MFLASAAVPRTRYLLLLSMAAPLLLNGCLPSAQPRGPLHPDSRLDTLETSPAAPPQILPPAPQEEQEPAFTPEERAKYEKQVLEPALATISGRISSYGQKLQDWQNLGKKQETLSLSPEQIERIITCRNAVADLQEAYKGLQEELRQEQSMEASRKLLFNSLQEFKQKDIAYLEGDCPQFFEDFSSLAQQDNVSAKQEEEVAAPVMTPVVEVEDSSKTENSTSPEAQIEDSSDRYERGLALLQAGQKDEARRLLSDLLAAVRQQKNKKMETKVLAMLADLDFAFRDYAAARVKYDELRQKGRSEDQYGRYLAALAASVTRRDELDAYADLLLGCLIYNPEKDGFTVVQQATEFSHRFSDSLLTEDADRLSKQVEQKAEQWFAALLHEADQLRAEGKQNEAVERLEQVPLDILPLDKQETVRQKKEELKGLTNSVESESELSETMPDDSFVPDQEAQTASPAPLPDPADALQDLWDKGMEAFQQGRYDEAVSLFSKLSGTSFGVKAEGKIEEAERFAAEELRKKAAELFQQADSAADPAAKEALLRSSKTLLEDILRKYPRSGMEEKVQRNLNSVDKKLAETGTEQSGH